MQFVDIILSKLVSKSRHLAIKEADQKHLSICTAKDLFYKPIPLLISSCVAFVLILVPMLLGDANPENLNAFIGAWFQFFFLEHCLPGAVISGCVSMILYNCESLKRFIVPVLETFVWVGFNGAITSLGGILALFIFSIFTWIFTGNPNDVFYCLMGGILFLAMAIIFSCVAATVNFHPIEDSHDTALKKSAQLAAQQHYLYVYLAITGVVLVAFCLLIGP